MTFQRVALTALLMLAVSSFSAAGVLQKVAKKKLPLDGVPNVVMKTPGTSQYLPDRVIVKLTAAVPVSKAAQTFGVSSLDRFVQQYNPRSIERLFPTSEPTAQGDNVDLTRFYVMKFTAPMDPFTVARELSGLPEVQYAEPWFIYPIDGVTACTPNDTSRSLQWGLTKIMADSAWCVSTGDTTVVIGIIDTGVQLDHPDLAANIWHNPGEMGLDSLGRDKRFNGVDDDGDGLVDDWQGWDFGGADYNNPVGDNNPSPVNTSSGHGTHVAGVASAVTNNTTGVAGIGYNCRIMAVKTSSDNDTRGGGFPYIVFGFEGIQYAADHGARIINCSWGGSGASQFEQDMINYATAKGSLVVAAAGNNANAIPGYPASYANVISAAATNINDGKTSYSSYGPTVDVSAPGGEPFDTYTVAIYSTDYPSTYGNEAGTSFSSPFTAGLAALVASKNPGYTPLQVGEQVRVTCDDINAQNAVYANLLGKGRINALKALTVSSPSIRMTTLIVKDSAGKDANGILKPNQTYKVAGVFTNYLQGTTSSATITLSTPDTNVQVVSGNYSIGSLATNSSASDSTSPFQVFVKPNALTGHTVMFTLSMSDANYSDVQLFTLLINPTFATHNVNKVDVTFTNNGRIGFNDFPDNTQGDGFVYPYPGGGNQLFEGGLILGTSSTKLVDVVRNNLGVQDADFITSQTYNIVTPGTISSQDGNTSFTDSGASSTNRIGVSVNMYSYEFLTPPDSNYVIVRYDVTNISGAPISGLYAGIFFDWDMLPNYATNRTSYDPGRHLGYAWDTSLASTVFCGARTLDSTVNYYAIINGSTPPDLSRSSKWLWLSGGVVTTDSVNDIHFVISSGPYSIASGGTQMIAFALLGGANLPSLQASADAAQLKWNAIRGSLAVDDAPGTIPLRYALRQNYPNPFNPTTTISYDLPKSSRVVLNIYDVLGREVRSLVDREQPAGRHEVSFDASALSTGMYFFRLTAGQFTDVKKLLLVK